MRSVSPIVDKQISVLLFIRVLLVRSLATRCSSGSKWSSRSPIVLILRAIRRVWWIQGAYVVSLSAAGCASAPTAKEIARCRWRRGTSTTDWRLCSILTAILTILLHEVPLMLCLTRHVESHIAIHIKLILQLTINCTLPRRVNMLLIIRHEEIRALVALQGRSLTTLRSFKIIMWSSPLFLYCPFFHIFLYLVFQTFFFIHA